MRRGRLHDVAAVASRGPLALAATVVVVLGLVVGPCARPASATPSGAASAVAASTCRGSRAPAPTHVVWIMLENVGYSVVGSPDAPYLNSLAAHCALATQYVAVAHPSLPNYVALTSGSTQGITDDAEPVEHPLAVPNLFSQLRGNWRTYAESMPSACDRVTSGLYAARHNPAVYYTNLPTCAADDVALGSRLDLSHAFTLIVPNVCDDMHSCPVATGDAWLAAHVPAILDSALYRAGRLVLFITFDENDESATNRVPCVALATQVVAGTRLVTHFTHYSLLRTTEALAHLPVLGGARSASSMLKGLRL